MISMPGAGITAIAGDAGEIMPDKHEWKCPNGHILGMVARNGRGTRKLQLFREAVYFDPLGSDFECVDVIAKAVGVVLDVRCSICGATRTWVPGQEYIDDLIARHSPQALTVEEGEE